MDGARGGWVLVTTRLDGKAGSAVSVVADLDSVMARIDTGELSALAVDIPIGLPEADPRSCDVEARKLIGERRNSVFPAPLRSSVGSLTYEEACERSRTASGKAMSRQAFAILPKVESVDRLMTPERQSSVVEVHPEVCFTVLAGRPMRHHKSKAEGRAERLEALRSVFPDVDEHVTRRLPGTHPDDILDAFVAAWTARRWLDGTYRRLGGDVDERGLRMEMIA